VPRQGTFRYEVRARCEVADAVALLSDYRRHAELHPLIERVRQVPTSPGASGSYLITDRLALGQVRFPITYTVDVLTATDREIIAVARQRPGTTVRNHTRLRPTVGNLDIGVEITVTAPLVLFPYAFRQARAAHAVLAEGIRAALTR
jgi:hypothetical protein